MSSEQVRNWKMRCSTWMAAPQALGAGERAVELDALAPRRARELDAREVLADADLQVGERLVVLQVDVEARLDVLDQPGLQQQGIDLGVGRDEVDVGDELDQVGGAAVLGGGLGEVVRRPGCAGSWPCRRRGRGPASSFIR